MRCLLPIVLALLLAGCGSSASPAPTPASTRLAGYTDPSTGVTVRVVKHVMRATYGLLYVQMENPGVRAYQSGGGVPFLDSALVEPNTPGKIRPCDSDSSLGPGLEYSAVPAHGRHTGWIRCDYSPGAHVMAVFWESHQVAAFRIR